MTCLNLGRSGVGFEISLVMPPDFPFPDFDRVFVLLQAKGEIIDPEFRVRFVGFFVLFKMTATRGNKTLTANCCEVARWHDGQITEAWVFTSDQYGFDEFWSSGWFSEAADGVWARRVKL